jgi:shikimate kinase
VNDRADLALLAAREGLTPWGLHLGQEDLPAAEAKLLPGLGKVHIGASTHGMAEWAAVSAAFDHAGVGPIRGTVTKSDHAEPIGLDGLRAGCVALRAQAIADARPCFEAGAESLAMVGEIHRTADPAALGWAAQRLRWGVRPPFRRGQGLAIIGGSGAGKTTLGRKLAQRLALPFRDLDAAIEAREGCPVAAIFEASGEAAFRALESECLPRLMDVPAVVVLGGGAWEAQANREAVAAAGFAPLWLAETPGRAWERASRDPNRPLAQDRAAFMARWTARMPAWSQAPMLLAFGHSSRELVSALLD